MSTRCQIGVYDHKLTKLELWEEIPTDWVGLLYRHHDGYPEGAGEDIQLFLKEFIKARGFDAEYLGASLMAFLKQVHCGEPTERGGMQWFDGKVTVAALSHGVCRNLHGDIEWFYAIAPNGLFIKPMYPDGGDYEKEIQLITW